jgi:hypothetical protein
MITQGLHKTEIESTDFTETFVSLKSQSLYFQLYEIRNETTELP